MAKQNLFELTGKVALVIVSSHKLDGGEAVADSIRRYLTV